MIQTSRLDVCIETTKDQSPPLLKLPFPLFSSLLQFSTCSNDLDTTNTIHRTSFGSAINLNTSSLEETARQQHPLPCLLQTTTNNTNTPNYNHDNNNEQNNSLDYQNNSSSNTGRQPTFVATIYRRTDSSGIHGNYSYDAGNCAEVNEREMKMSLLLLCYCIVCAVHVNVISLSNSIPLFVCETVA